MYIHIFKHLYKQSTYLYHVPVNMCFIAKVMIYDAHILVPMSSTISFTTD